MANSRWLGSLPEQMLNGLGLLVGKPKGPVNFSCHGLHPTASCGCPLSLTGTRPKSVKYFFYGNEISSPQGQSSVEVVHER